jgi:5,10-methenyltetrahydromethanopterin hydrogenase
MTTPAQDQFVEDYLLVVDNEREAYDEAMEIAKSGDMVQVSEKMREQFETYITEVAEREREAGHEVGALLISQLLLNWGSDTFDRIARHFLDKD